MRDRMNLIEHGFENLWAFVPTEHFFGRSWTKWYPQRKKKEKSSYLQEKKFYSKPLWMNISFTLKTVAECTFIECHSPLPVWRVVADDWELEEATGVIWDFQSRILTGKLKTNLK